MQRQGSVDIVIALAGNKCDMEAKRQVATDEAKAFASEKGCIFFETSAKTGECINEVFTAIGIYFSFTNPAFVYLYKYLATKLPKSNQPADVTTIKVITRDDSAPKKKCC